MSESNEYDSFTVALKKIFMADSERTKASMEQDKKERKAKRAVTSHVLIFGVVMGMTAVCFGADKSYQTGKLLDVQSQS